MQIRRWSLVCSLLGSIFRFSTHVGRKGIMAGLREIMGCKRVLRNPSSYSMKRSGVGMALQSDRLGSYLDVNGTSPFQLGRGQVPNS